MRSITTLDELRACVSDGDSESLTAFVKSGVSIANADGEPFGPVTVAAEARDVVVLKALLRHGGSANDPDPNALGWTSLMYAAERDAPDVIRVLIESGGRPELRNDERGQTALMLAAAAGHSGAVDVLLERARTDTRDEAGWTALMIAAHAGHESVALALVQSRADTHRRHDGGETAAAIAERVGHAELGARLRMLESETSLEDRARALLTRYRDELDLLDCPLEPARPSGSRAEAIAELAELGGRELPAELVAYFDVVGQLGAAPILEYEALGLDAALEEARAMRRTSAENEARRDKTPVHSLGGLVRERWWHEAWIPIARDGGGNLICVDLDPAPDGCVGQVIGWEIHGGPVAPRAPSVLEHLARLSDDFGEERYVYDPETGIFDERQ